LVGGVLPDEDLSYFVDGDHVLAILNMSNERYRAFVSFEELSVDLVTAHHWLETLPGSNGCWVFDVRVELLNGRWLRDCMEPFMTSRQPQLVLYRDLSIEVAVHLLVANVLHLVHRNIRIKLEDSSSL